ncbi:zinc-dependent metalloprotease [soil metagenome]
MSDDDLFSRLFELFNQPGPVNWKLASEVSHHLTGDRTPVEPWAAEEYRELARVAEYRLEQASSLIVAPATDVLPVDAREWADRHLESFGYLTAGLADVGGLSAGPMAQLAPAMVGMQVGSLVGGLARWVLAGFDGGLPPDRPLPMAVVVPHVEAFAARHGFDLSSVRLWVVSEEVAFRAVTAIPFVTDHLRGLLEAEASTTQFDPSALTSLMGMGDPAEMQEIIAGQLGEMFNDPATMSARDETQAFLGLVAGYARLLSERSLEELLPDRQRLVAARDDERAVEDQEIPFGPKPPSSDSISRGRSFCVEVDRRYGAEELIRLWTAPERIPTAPEIADPVAWAARVLLDDF